MRLIAGWVTLNSRAARVKFRCRAAASNMNSAPDEGNLLRSGHGKRPSL
jgi:hypothetical protein